MKRFLLIACWIICSASARNSFSQEWNNEPSDEYGNLVKRDLTETVEQTEEDLPNRVFFYLYTRNNSDNPEQLFIDDVETLNNSNFDTEKETKIVTHGWRGSYTDRSCQLVLQAYLQNSDCNVILIDWNKIANNEYFWVSSRVVIVSQFAGRMVSFLESQGMDANNLTIVGHSLGAHVAGLTSQYSNEKANYIVGLDPAGPDFIQRPSDSRLSRGQGNFVEVIHSDAGFAGLYGDLGDADFWPDGGLIQFGCQFLDAIPCSHSRSYEYFAESINSKIGFVGVQCPNYIEFKLNLCNGNPRGIMGGAEPQSGLSGNYYLYTNSNSPYAEGSPS